MRPNTLRLLRVLAILIPLIGIITDGFVLSLIWSKGQAPSPIDIYDTATLIGGVPVLAMALLFAWRGGDHPPNVSMARASLRRSIRDPQRMRERRFRCEVSESARSYGLILIRRR